MTTDTTTTATASSYQPQEGSVAYRVCHWFRRHPNAELSSAEVAESFGCKSGDLTALLASAVTAQLLHCERRDFAGVRGRYFSAGAKIGQLAPSHSQAAAPQPTPQAAAQAPKDASHYVPTGVVPRPVAAAPTPTVAAPTAGASLLPGFCIRTDLPRPPATQADPHSYRAMLSQLEPGQALEYPRERHDSVSRAVRKINADNAAQGTGPRYTARIVDATRAAAWRDS